MSESLSLEFQPQELQKLRQPFRKSHKGENGKVLIIGGSSLFHSAPLWGAELLAHFADLVFFYSPTRGNRDVFWQQKARFQNGLVIETPDLEAYFQEAEVVLMGPGMKRQTVRKSLDYKHFSLSQIEQVKDEGELTYLLTNQLLSRYPQKKVVVDAGALQELEKENICSPFILTPHWQEFLRLFPEEPALFEVVNQYPATYLLKREGIDTVVSATEPNKQETVSVGNEGLTKGGTGDLLAALVAAFYLKNPPRLSASAASFVLNKAADELYLLKGPYYTTTELLHQIPTTYWEILKNLK